MGTNRGALKRAMHRTGKVREMNWAQARGQYEVSTWALYCLQYCISGVRRETCKDRESECWLLTGNQKGSLWVMIRQLLECDKQ